MSNQNISEKDMRKLRAMIAYAENSDYEGERENAWRAATGFMAKLSVGPEILNEVHDVDYTTKPEMFECEIGDPYSREKIDLLSGLAEVFSCRVIWMRVRGRSKGYKDVMVHGFQRDLDILWTLYVSISTQMMSEMRKQDISSVSFRKSFISFFSAEVIDRVETFYRKAVEEESGEQGAIVLRDRSSQVDRAVEEAYGEIKTDQRKAPDLDIDGALAGREAGERADVTLDDRKMREDEALSISH